MTVTPLTARFFFKCWLGVSGLFAIFGFTVLFILLRVATADGTVATVISLTVTLFIFFSVLLKQPLGFYCTNANCGKYVSSKTPWICGFKQCRNDDLEEHPFIGACKHCGAEPKAYQCHHCGSLIYLSEDEQDHNFARCTRPFKERSDLDIPGLQEHLEIRTLEQSIEEVDQRNKMTAKPNDEAEIQRRKEEREVAEVDHKIRMSRLRAKMADEEAAEKRAEEANLPLRERTQRRQVRELERFRIADEGRAVVEKTYPKGSKQYQREMAFWDRFEEQASL